MQPKVVAVVIFKAGEKVGGYSAYLPSLETAHRVGRRVVHALVEGWPAFHSTPPSAPP